MGQRFLAIDVLTTSHRIQSDVCVHVVRCGYGHCVDLVTTTFKHVTIILEDLCIRSELERLISPRQINITKGNMHGPCVIRHSRNVRVALAVGSDRR